jgi:hypothetical protein
MPDISHRSSTLISPYGGELVNLLAESDECPDLIDKANRLQALQLSPRLLYDLDLVMKFLGRFAREPHRYPGHHRTLLL